MSRLNPFDPLQRTVGVLGDTYDDATRLARKTTERAGRRTGGATEDAGRRVGDTTRRAGSRIEDTAARVGTRMQVGAGSDAGDIDIADRGGEFVATTGLPGFSGSEIDATVLSGQTLRIVAERDESPDESYLRQERDHGPVRRSVAFPEYVVGDAATAEYGNGVLTVTVPKADSAIPVEDTATAAVETHDAERPQDAAESTDAPGEEPPVAAAVEGSVADLEDALATGAYDDRLDAVADAEHEGDDRTTAHEVIDDRRATVRNAEE